MAERFRVGVIGCGNISGAYFQAAQSFKMLDYACCADVDAARAQQRAAEFHCRAVSVDELLNDPAIDAVLNLTTPAYHAAIDLAALRAGKHVYAEKPFALTLAEGQQIMQEAAARNLRVGSAPDTFLGGSHQCVRKLIDDGWIGEVLSGTAFMQCPGHESWHPQPEFYYRKGGGPLFDMGPYYITALVNLLGPVKRVVALAHKGFAERLCRSEARRGDRLPVEVNTHVAGVLEFAGGALITMVMSFDVRQSDCQWIELHGSEGSLSVPDPNGFGGAVRYARGFGRAWESAPVPFEYTENMRSIGLADMAMGVMGDRPHRCNGELALHVLEVMCALEDAAREGRAWELVTTCTRPAPLPMNGNLD